MTNFDLIIPKILPTLTLSSVDEAKKVCDLLRTAKINSLEVTLRSGVSYEAIEYISSQSEINLGLGTVLNLEQLLKFKDLKIAYVVSPGFDEGISNYCKL